MKKLSILFASVFVLALTSCKKADCKTSNENDSTIVVVDSTNVDSVNVSNTDTIQTK